VPRLRSLTITLSILAPRARKTFASRSWVSGRSYRVPCLNIAIATIQIPVDFGTEKENELRQSFTQELPGLTLTIQGGESVAKPRIGAISIDDFAYVRSAKAAEEWRNAAEKAETKSDPFPVVAWAASKTLRQFLRGYK
jgi:hypothetical protein